jgi:lipopolysaccharide export system protein LptA
LKKIASSWLFLLLGFAVLAQKEKKIELISADELNFDESLGANAKKLIGNVKFKQEQTFLTCDSAYLYENNKIEAFGNVTITGQDGLLIKADKLLYDGDTKMANLNGNSFLTDQNISLSTQNLNYDIKSKIGTYNTPATIISNKDKNTLKSKRGVYNSDNKEITFIDSVKLVDKKYTIYTDTLKHKLQNEISFFYGPTQIVSKDGKIFCNYGWYDAPKQKALLTKKAKITSDEQELYGDSILYDMKLGIANAYNNISIVDTAQKLTIKGKYAFINELKNHAFVTKDAEMQIQVEKDTLFLHADTLKTFGDSAENKKIYAYYNVAFFKKDMQGRCDSLAFITADSVIKMFHKPIIWNEENQITGDTISIAFTKENIKELNVLSKAMMISMNDSIHYNQIKGKKIQAFFKKNEIERIDILQNGESIYYVKNEQGKLKGMNKAVCQNMRILVKDSEIQKVVFLKKPVATLYPLKDVTEDELYLKGFEWRIVERPIKKADIFLPKILNKQ